jgi:hypothetical protein
LKEAEEVAAHLKKAEAEEEGRWMPAVEAAEAAAADLGSLPGVLEEAVNSVEVRGALVTATLSEAVVEA